MLKITEHNTAIIQFNNLRIVGCSSGMNVNIQYCTDCEYKEPKVDGKEVIFYPVV